MKLFPVPLRRVLAATPLLFSAYAAVAYVVAPAAWSRYQRRTLHAEEDRMTYTAERLPADPLNVALVGSRAELASAMRRAGWSEADPITFRSGFRDASSVLFALSYPTAPMSTHYLRGRSQEIAFERIVGGSPRRRHHVRFWRAEERSADGRPIWIGAASYDTSVGFSRYTGELMHHIDPRIDAERETLLSDLSAARCLERIERLRGFRPAGRAKNGGGDVYETDGALAIGELPGSQAGRLYSSSR